jgi:hypothetical protein
VAGAKGNTEAVKKQILDFLAKGYTVQKACDAVSRSVKSYEYYRRTDPQFAAAVDRLRSLHQRGELLDRPAVGEFAEFSEKFLGAQIFTHQQHWVDLLESREPTEVHPSITYEKGEDDLLIVNTPPEHAKSTTVTVNYVTYRIAQNPNVRIIVVSKTQAMARKFLFAIKSRLTHPKYQDLQLAFGPAGGYEKGAEAWTQDMIYLSGEARDSGEKDPTVQALGVRGHIYGARADLIIMDDCVDNTNAHEYEKQIDWLQSEVLSRLSPGGKLLVIGTRLRPRDLYSELRDPARYPEERSPWTYFAQPAVLEFHDEPADWVTLWPKTNVPEVGATGPIEPDENGLYDKWNGLNLSKKRSRMSPRVWAMVYQQQQVHDDAVFTAEAVKGVVCGSRQAGLIPRGMPGVRPEGMDGLTVVAGLDPAMAGYTAAVAVGLDISTQKRYLLDVSNVQGMTPDAIRELIRSWTVKYNILEWRIEKNAFQAMLTQDREVREFLSGRGCVLREHHTGANKWDSDFGVASLTTLFSGWQDGRALIELPSSHGSEGVKALVEQLITWYPDAPKAQKTDTVMATWFAELACRDRIQAVTNYQRSHVRNPFLTQWDRTQQSSVNLYELESEQITSFI